MHIVQVHAFHLASNCSCMQTPPYLLALASLAAASAVYKAVFGTD
jgi:hypothetical protein